MLRKEQPEECQKQLKMICETCGKEHDAEDRMVEQLAGQVASQVMARRSSGRAGDPHGTRTGGPRK